MGTSWHSPHHHIIPKLFLQIWETAGTRFRLLGGWGSSVGKVLMAVSDTKGILQLQFVDRRTAVNADCYCTTVLHLKEANMSPYFFSAGIKQVMYHWCMPQSLVIMWRSKGFLCYSAGQLC
jgi:hypothetical protein